MPTDLGELGITDYNEEIIFLSPVNICNNTGTTTQHVFLDKVILFSVLNRLTVYE